MTKPTPTDQQRRPPSDLSLENRLAAIERRLAALEALTLPMRPIGPLPAMNAIETRAPDSLAEFVEQFRRALTAGDETLRKAVSARTDNVEGQEEGE